VLAETNDNFNDHLYGYGYLGPDPAIDGYYYYWDHCSTGAKSLTFDYQGPTQLAVPSFQVQRRLVDESYVRDRIGSSFNMTGTLGSDDLFFYLLDTSGGITRTLMVDKISGSYNFRNWGKLWNTPVVTPTLISGREAAAFAEEFYKMHGEALPGAFYRNAGFSYNVESLVQDTVPGFSVNGVQQVSQMPADGMLTYGRGLNGPALTTEGIQLADFPVVGPGGRAKLYFGDGGELIGAMGGSRDVTLIPNKLIEVMPAADAWKMYLDDPSIALPEVPWVASYISYTAATLGYYEMAYLIEQSELIPVWIFNANFYGPSMELLAGDVPVYVPAALQYMPPQVSITDPISGTLFAPNVPIQFKGTVQGGLAPYTFTWSSSQDGLLGATQDIVAPLSGGELKAGEVLVHVIKLDVTDANGQSRTATVIVKVMANVYLPTVHKPIPE
jgi:hypothetical protein